MWPSLDMVARVLVEERERKIARGETMRRLRAKEENVCYSTNESIWGTVLVLAIMVILLVGDAILA